MEEMTTTVQRMRKGLYIVENGCSCTLSVATMNREDDVECFCIVCWFLCHYADEN